MILDGRGTVGVSIRTSLDNSRQVLPNVTPANEADPR
jgi:hypothetical protein